MKIEWTKQRIEEASELWMQNMTTAAIAAELGTTAGAIQGLASYHRHLFPKRRESPRARFRKAKVVERGYVEEPAPKPVKPWRPDRVTRITKEGVSITMPRVTFIDGPAP